MKNTMNSKLGTHYAKAIAASSTVSIALMLLLCTLISSLIINGRMKVESMRYAVMAILMLVSAVGALVAAAKISEKRIIVCILSGASFFAELLCITALFFNGVFEGIGVTAMVILGGSIIAALLPARKSRGVKIKRYKKSYS